MLLSKKIKINHQIRAQEVDLIDETGKRLGIKSLGDAIRLAKEKGLDLAEVSSHRTPPVVKVIDYGQLKYRMKKQQQKQKSKAKKIEVKGIRIGFQTNEHDLEFKANTADKFLKQGNSVKIEMVLKGRERAYLKLAFEKLEKFVKEYIETKIKIEQRPKKMGRGIVMTVMPEK